MATKESLDSIAKSAKTHVKKATISDDFSIPEKAAEAILPNEPAKKEAPVEKSGMVDEEEDDNLTLDEVRNEEQEAAVKKISDITMDDVKASMPNLDSATLEKQAPKLYAQIASFRKKLIIEEGMSPEEADIAARNRLKRQGGKINNKFIDEHPHTGIITINKEDERNIQLTPEEHDKLVTTKAIKLVLVESQELESLNVFELPENTDKIRYIQQLNSSLAHYEIPLPTLGDYVGFRGATTSQLAEAAVDRENETSVEALERKANFIYDRWLSSHSLPKYDENNNVVMSFDEFCEKFPYFDIDMAMYAIYVASSPESYSAPMNCPFCKKDFEYTFIAKDMLDQSEFPDIVKSHIHDIITHLDNAEYYQDMYKKNMQTMRFKSSKTGNIYALESPSISRAKAVLNVREPNTTSDGFSVIGGLLVRELWINDTSKNGYVHVAPTDVGDIIHIMDELNEYDVNLIAKFATDYIYTPKFQKKHICPNCGKEVTIAVGLDDLVFLRGRDILAEIQ